MTEKHTNQSLRSPAPLGSCRSRGMLSVMLRCRGPRALNLSRAAFCSQAGVDHTLSRRCPQSPPEPFARGSFRLLGVNRASTGETSLNSFREPPRWLVFAGHRGGAGLYSPPGARPRGVVMAPCGAGRCFTFKPRSGSRSTRPDLTSTPFPVNRAGLARLSPSYPPLGTQTCPGAGPEFSEAASSAMRTVVKKSDAGSPGRSCDAAFFRRQCGFVATAVPQRFIKNHGKNGARRQNANRGYAAAGAMLPAVPRTTLLNPGTATQQPGGRPGASLTGRAKTDDLRHTPGSIFVANLGNWRMPHANIGRLRVENRTERTACTRRPLRL